MEGQAVQVGAGVGVARLFRAGEFLVRRRENPPRLKTGATQAAEKLGFGVILSEAKNLSSI
jgi:hypothetical protein